MVTTNHNTQSNANFDSSRCYPKSQMRIFCWFLVRRAKKAKPGRYSPRTLIHPQSQTGFHPLSVDVSPSLFNLIQYE
ncbi:hypothetical protein ACTXT7_001843 [Hymenolepis weldensis]